MIKIRFKGIRANMYGDNTRYYLITEVVTNNSEEELDIRIYDEDYYKLLEIFREDILD